MKYDSHNYFTLSTNNDLAFIEQ